jgi:hypothetical protein
MLIGIARIEGAVREVDDGGGRRTNVRHSSRYIKELRLACSQNKPHHHAVRRRVLAYVEESDQEPGTRRDKPQIVLPPVARNITTMLLTIPDPSLVVLIGSSDSGKSSVARTHFKPTEILSSDACRGLVADDENDPP